MKAFSRGDWEKDLKELHNDSAEGTVFLTLGVTTLNGNQV